MNIFFTQKYKSAVTIGTEFSVHTKLQDSLCITVYSRYVSKNTFEQVVNISIDIFWHI